MPDVKALEDAVKALQPQDLAEFRSWFAEFDLAVWDKMIDTDAASGKLDALLAEAEEDYKTGQCSTPDAGRGRPGTARAVASRRAGG